VNKRSTRNIAITTGDSDGIGLEVTLKALRKLGPKKSVSFQLYMPQRVPSHLKDLHKQVVRQFSQSIHWMHSSDSPAHWVELSAQACMRRETSALVTAPLSKETILNSGLKDVGHTDILKRISKSTNLHMGFMGRYFHVVLATGHTSLRNVSSQITFSGLQAAYESALLMLPHLKTSVAQRPLALVGLNPHAGENGIIGDEEVTTYSQFIASINSVGGHSRAQKTNQPGRAKIIGPLVPDAAFLKSNWSRFSIYICSYHDQGLIPFKMVHGFSSGVHITLGLPFLRVSVDHGTAKDIFKLNTADCGSMYEALKLAIKHTQRLSHEI
jgi:4-hydroxythreonine-4-phosphate dehydrogenase